MREGIKYRIVSPDGEPDTTKIYVTEDSWEKQLPNIKRIEWGVEANGVSWAKITVLGVKLG